MAKKNSKTPPKPKFNSYWIYGGIILFFLSLNFLSGDDTSSDGQQINISTFERYLNNGDVSNVKVINKSVAQVTLTDQAFNSPTHKAAQKKNFLGQLNSKGPHYQFEVGNLELFQRKLEAAEQNNIAFTYEFKTIEDRWLGVLLNFLPLILIIGIWIFLMRRMSGGGAGGAGGQIFNIGKSKAQTF